MFINRIFPGFRRARKAFRSVGSGHFRTLRYLLDSGNEGLRDLSDLEIRTINQSSMEYYQVAENAPYWSDKPFSDGGASPWLLWRFAVLSAGLRLIPRIRILDFGCGSGWTSIMLSQMGSDVVGMDIAPRAIDIANLSAERILRKEQRERCSFTSFDGQNLPFADDSFDIVVIYEALHHLPNPIRILKEIFRVLSKHGRLGFAEPGIGHSHHEHSVMEMNHGILESDLELDHLYNTGKSLGFRQLDLLIQGVHPDVFSLPMSRLRWYLNGASWLVPADFVRHAIVTGPIGIFSKSPYPASSLNPVSHRATLSTNLQELSVLPDSTYKLHVNARNDADTVWLSRTDRGIGSVTLGASLLSAEGLLVIKDYGRTPLPTNVQKGDKLSLTMELVAPSSPGNYIVRLDMVNEGVCWFSENQSKELQIKLRVA